jgi:hypothetical protein
MTAELVKLIDDKKASRTIAAVWLKKILEGDARFFAMMLDRTEGKVPESRSDESGGMADIISEYLRDERPKTKAKAKAKPKRRPKGDAQT